ncbi:uncharacterized protein LOC126054217 [Helicoverpa armigera]|uniref:uncharacterized protein LOC126054217 n=1 Tax=Helicoverpa armigera TaxID=29058 RepID=UPI003082D7F0
MGKRKYHYKDKDIRRKIRRLEDKLARRGSHDRDHRRRYQDRYRRSETPSSYSSDEHDAGERYYNQSDEENAHPSRCQEQLSDGDYILCDSDDYLDNPQSKKLASTVQVASPAANPPPAASPKQGLPVDPGVSQTLTTTGISVEEVTPTNTEVPQEILNILGEAKKIEQQLGEKIPAEISERWGKILLDGLAKEQKDSLIEKMLIPENFLLAKAPKLNPEVAAVLSDAAKNRDKRLEKSQNQLGCGLAGLVNITNHLIKEDMDKFDIIKRISEVSQLLLDLHYEETINRRKLIIPLLDKKFWNTIQGVKRETYLFGDKLGENIKNTKDIEKSSQHIKKATPAQQPFQRRTTSLGNARGPPRQQQSQAKPTTSATNRFQPPPAATRRTQQPRARPAPSSRHHDRRHK